MSRKWIFQVRSGHESWCPDAYYLFLNPWRKWSIERFFPQFFFSLPLVSRFNFRFNDMVMHQNTKPKFHLNLEHFCPNFSFQLFSIAIGPWWFHWMICKLQIGMWCHIKVNFRQIYFGIWTVLYEFLSAFSLLGSQFRSRIK